MPEKVHDCAMDLQAKGKSEDSSWAICNSSVKECEVCGDLEHEPTDHPYIPQMESTALSIAGVGLQEHHNPLDIPFGYEVKEVNKNVKDVDEGGLGSGREPEGGEQPSGGQAGPLVSFETVSIPSSASATSIGAKKLEETIIKQLMDSKLACPCNRK